MKTRWILWIAFMLSIVVGGSPVLAGVYGHRHYRQPHYRYHQPHYRYQHHHRYYHGGDIFLGTLFGFTLGALLTPPPPPPTYIYREYPPPVVYREYVYLPDSSQIRQGPISTSDTQALKDTSCLQTREYTTTIIIEGKEVDAYGTKCLRPDGTWSYGPAQPVPSN